MTGIVEIHFHLCKLTSEQIVTINTKVAGCKLSRQLDQQCLNVGVLLDDSFSE